MNSRRIFMAHVAALGCPSLHAQSGKQVDEASEQAVALGYKHDTTQVDAKRYPQHKPAQRCSNCSFWQGKADDAWAGCAMFGRKQIAAAGWCQVWAKAPG